MSIYHFLICLLSVFATSVGVINSSAYAGQILYANPATTIWRQCDSSQTINNDNIVKSIGFKAGLDNSRQQDTLVHTRVLTDTGYQTRLKPIKDIEVGDEVLAWDELQAHDNAALAQAGQAAQTLQAAYQQASLEPRLDTKLASNPINMGASSYENKSAQRYEKVTDTISSFKEQTLLHISLDNGQTIQATAGHPFKTLEGWRDAVLLKKGGQLLLGGEADAAERYVTILGIREEVKTTAVFNLEVANLHTFFVGVDGVVVHNGNPTRGIPGTYEFPDLLNQGKMYVGKAADLADRTGKWQRKGRCGIAGVNPMQGSTDLQRRVAEQKRIQELGGIGGGKVSNQINPISPKDWTANGIF